MAVYWVSFLASFLVCTILVLTKNKHIRLTGSSDETAAVQASHVAPTPRIGGLAVMAGMTIGAAITFLQGQKIFMTLLMTALPMYLTGLAEDVIRHISTKLRYSATLLSALIVVWAMEIWITTADSFLLDWIFQFTPVAVLVTIFVVASYCHAFNLIDGLNGLASGTSLLISVGLAAIATFTGQSEIVTMSMITAFSVTGFFLFNYPFGRIFLGDAGAYIIGYMLTWTAIVTLHEAPETSAWAMLLLFFWPLADTLFAIYRRRRKGVSFDTADRLHFHQLVLRGLEIFFLGRDKRTTANPLATSVLLPFIAAPVAAGVTFWNEPVLSFVALCLFGGAFVGTYQLGLRAARARVRRPRSRLLQNASPTQQSSDTTGPMLNNWRNRTNG
ncbi:UDP-N-acetylmuramyl pentapeptide phosphotransferase/UDP-N-acetylglucosamine-1-phosphate transferase [Ruegeria intermedia]|uniref:UDP-N-acetylmuramyl pentapeptide phosphotransferase/UDP-N-acetylglucosamine-1-phosphate transferase n=1 Tax=Ruegeria intermedia TaxID=996115 RepID=A0A1M5B3Y0_9RHOB|nr:glycosyltransferase [Ruegeria intermedia]SHF37224.1 UDP-N-acetylmuramyl pentapeptide phosphotransferase/UDP-N-acetylglucosamine-1-phosphate transferase [Ruegeria intermedia]